VREVIANLLSLQDLEMGGKRLSSADKETITQLRARIPEPILGHYDRMRAREKKAVALVRNKVCSACHMGIPIGIITVLMRGADIQLCGSCGRYLHLPPEAPAEPPAPAPVEKPKKRRKKAEPPVPEA
jgi:predicted  nucleic acid-binding Zn-ribbon protein